MDAIKNWPHILSIAKQVYKFLSNIGSLFLVGGGGGGGGGRGSNWLIKI